jgi:dihydroorotase
MEKLTIRAPDDFHVHVRQGEMLGPMVQATARYFKRALIMPNTTPPIATAGDVARYRQEILAVSPSGFQPIMTFKVLPTTTVSQVWEIHHRSWAVGKLYPDGVTTNSEGGVRDFRSLWSVFGAMQHCNLVLCLHGETPDVFCLDREEKFLEVLAEILEDFPRLKVVMEHLSTAAAVDFVANYQDRNLGATVTVHHLDLTLDDIIGGSLSPHHFCKPVAKRPQDRERLIEAVTEKDQTRFFLGTDSAPHLRADKECDCGAAGVFTAPLALPLLAEIFEAAGALDQMERFTSVNGAEFYRQPLNEGQITLVREEWTVPKEYDGVVPLRAGQTIQWKVKQD